MKQSPAPMNQNTLNPKTTNSFKAAVMVLNSDASLIKAIKPYINSKDQTIDWKAIMQMPFHKQQKSAVDFAFAIYSETSSVNIFSKAHAMTPFMKVAVLEALCLNWGLRG